MDIHLLKTFVAAYEEANFTKAARRLNATQPGVSVQIATLEASVRASLFDRNARSVIPTVAGRRLYPRALQLIRDLNSTTQEIRALAGAVTERVAIGIPPTLSKAILPPVLSRYLAAYPQSDVRIIELPSDGLLSLIDSRELDLAFVTHLPNQTAVAERSLCRDPVVLASGPLAGIEQGRAVQLDAEPRFKIVVPSMLRNTLNGILDEPLRSGRIAAERIIEMDGLDCTLEFVAMTDWVALLPAAAVYNKPKGVDVRFNTIAGNAITVQYSVVHARTEPLSLAAEAFIDLAAAELNRVATKWRPRLVAKSPRRRSPHVDAAVEGVVDAAATPQPVRSALVSQRDSRSNLNHPGSAPFLLQAAGE